LVLTMLGVQYANADCNCVTTQLGVEPMDGDPVSVMRIPALGPAVMAPVGVKVTTTVVAKFLTGFPRVMARFANVL
jgi:hypothetical protein